MFIDRPGETRYGDIEAPTPGDDEVVLHIDRVGFCGSDLNTFRGRNPMVTYPRIPGHEIAGTILATGATVPDSFEVGGHVTINPYTSCGTCPACEVGRPNACQDNHTLGVQRDGALTEKIAVPWRQLIVSNITDLNHLALIEPIAVGFHAVRRGRVSGSDTVVVFGCGPIGLGAIAGSARHGARVIAVDLDDGRLNVAKAVGAADVVNTAKCDAVEKIAELTDGSGANVAIEAVGIEETFQACVEVAAPAGRVVYVGYAKAPVTYETKQFLVKELDILGSRNALREDFEDAAEYVESGSYPCDLTISKVVEFAQAGTALKQWQDNPTLVTKIIVENPAPDIDKS